MDRKETEIRAAGDPGRAGSGGQGTRVDTVDTVEPVVSRFESLLRQGEAFFAAEQYERAIHVWTRVLFLERGHLEARQGIDRAKRTLAERQRRIDASVAEARLLFEQGKLDEAGETVQSVLRVDPRHGEACVLDAELTASARRSEPPLASAVPELEPRTASSKGVVLRVSRPRAQLRSPARRASKSKVTLFAIGVALAFAAGGFVLHANWERLVGGAPFERPEAFGSAASLAPVPAEVPSLSELFYYNGARLFEKERYREALRELGRVERDSVVADEARSLILRIEERLLRGALGREGALEAVGSPADAPGAKP